MANGVINDTKMFYTLFEGITRVKTVIINADNEDAFILNALGQIKEETQEFETSIEYASVNHIYAWFGNENYVFFGYRVSGTWLYALCFSWDRAYLLSYNCNAGTLYSKKTITLT